MARVTMKQVAARAGVSYQTVSNVMNDSPMVRQETRDRVLEAIRELDYEPSFAGRALREAKAQTLNCVFFEHSAYDVADPYRSLIQGAITYEASRRGYSMLTSFLYRNEPATFDALRQTYRRGRFDGAVVVGSSFDRAAASQLELWGLPLVLYDYCGAPVGLPQVTGQYAEGMEQLVAHLARGGRRRLALVIALGDSSTGEERRRGFLEAVRARGVEGVVLEGDWSFASGERAFKAAWSGRWRPDAVVAGNDRMAAGCLAAARELEVAVPDEVAVTGFDDFEFGLYTAPSLTTVRVPYAEMASEAVGMLVGLVEGEAVEPAVRRLPVTLVQRQSA